MFPYLKLMEWERCIKNTDSNVATNPLMHGIICSPWLCFFHPGMAFSSSYPEQLLWPLFGSDAALVALKLEGEHTGCPGGCQMCGRAVLEQGCRARNALPLAQLLGWNLCKGFSSLLFAPFPAWQGFVPGRVYLPWIPAIRTGMWKRRRGRWETGREEGAGGALAEGEGQEWELGAAGHPAPGSGWQLPACLAKGLPCFLNTGWQAAGTDVFQGAKTSTGCCFASIWKNSVFVSLHFHNLDLIWKEVFPSRSHWVFSRALGVGWLSSVTDILLLAISEKCVVIFY